MGDVYVLHGLDRECGDPHANWPELLKAAVFNNRATNSVLCGLGDNSCEYLQQFQVSVNSGW